MNYDIAKISKSLNDAIDSQGVVLLQNKKVFQGLLKDLIVDDTGEKQLLCDAVETDVLDVLCAALERNHPFGFVEKGISNHINKHLKAYSNEDKKFVVSILLSLYSHITGSCEPTGVIQAETIDSDVSKTIESAASISAVMNKISKYLPKSFNPKIIPIALFAIMEIVGVIYVLSTSIIEFALGESAGSYAALQFVLVIHALVGCVLCRCAKVKGLSYVSSSISAIIAGYSFIYAMTDLTGGGGLEGAFVSFIGFFFFGAIELGVIALCFKLPSWIDKV